MSVKSQETIQDADDLKIFFRSWRPETEARATVVIVPGFNAHSGYYEYVAEHLVADGLSVYAVDLRGRGNSEGERFFVESFDDYVHDVEAVMEIVKTREPASPMFMLGHKGRWFKSSPRREILFLMIYRNSQPREFARN
jgi:acylglycerol lipase